MNLRLPVLAAALAASATLAACTPPPQLPPPPTLPRPTTTTTTTTTTTMPGPACLQAVDPTPDGTLSAADAADAAERAVKAAPGVSAQGVVPLVVVSERDGRPSFDVVHVTGTAQARQAAAAAARRGDVVAVERNGRVSVTSDPREPDQWALSTLDAPTAWGHSTGSGTVVAVVDTGADTTHPDLAGQLLAGHSFLGGVESSTVTDGHGHGTHVSGIIAAGLNGVGTTGLAYDAQVLPVKVLDDQGMGDFADVADGVVWAVDNGADIVNMSLGAPEPSAAMAAAVQYAKDNGVLVVAAAGNDGPCADPNYPAALPDVLAVAATTPSGRAATFSSTGTYVDVAAPGYFVLSTFATTAGDLSGYAYLSGTSMASPYAAAAAALVLSAHPTWTADQVRAALESTAHDVMATGRDQWTGYGVVDPTAAIG